jgi:hypothetical protein
MLLGDHYEGFEETMHAIPLYDSTAKYTLL